MAIDTAEKRRSAAGVAFLPLGPGVTPNSEKDKEWRYQAAWSYSGVLVKVHPIGTVAGAVFLAGSQKASVFRAGTQSGPVFLSGSQKVGK